MRPPHETQPHEHKSLMRALGEFFGHIRGSITHNPSNPSTSSARTIREREERVEGDRRITLERTTTERMTIEPLEGRDQID